MRVLVQVEHIDIIELDVQVLVDGFESAADADVVFELNGHGLVCEGLEEAVDHRKNMSGLVIIRDWTLDRRTHLKKSMVEGQLRVGRA